MAPANCERSVGGPQCPERSLSSEVAAGKDATDIEHTHSSTHSFLHQVTDKSTVTVLPGAV
jgi:hypothetical protein